MSDQQEPPTGDESAKAAFGPVAAGRRPRSLVFKTANALYCFVAPPRRPIPLVAELSMRIAFLHLVLGTSVLSLAALSAHAGSSTGADAKPSSRDMTERVDAL